MSLAEKVKEVQESLQHSGSEELSDSFVKQVNNAFKGHGKRNVEFWTMVKFSIRGKTDKDDILRFLQEEYGDILPQGLLQKVAEGVGKPKLASMALELAEKVEEVQESLRENGSEELSDAFVKQVNNAFKGDGKRNVDFWERLTDWIQDETDKDQMFHVLQKRYGDILPQGLREAVAEGVGKQKHKGSRHDRPSERFADSLLGVPNTSRTHDMDFKHFKARIDQLFQWHQEIKDKKKNLYLAPYFPIIQSSGTGKTKLLYDLKTESQTQKDDLGYSVVLINCEGNRENLGSQGRLLREGAYDHEVENWFASSAGEQNEDEARKLDKENFIDIMDAFVEKANNPSKVVFLFDEAQKLASRHDGFLIRCLRWYLRKDRDKQQFVAVLAGTTSALANFYPEREQETTISRLPDPKSQYHTAGTDLYPPMIDLWTMGALKSRIYPLPAATEYEQAIVCGRPLFARLLLKDDRILNRGHKC